MIDVIIIGGGPAGITAGTLLQKKGYKTCIIDNKIFPREKLCAGVITVKALRLVKHIYKGIQLENLKIKHINKLSLFYNKKIIGNYTVENKFCVIDRTEFDNELLQYYKKVGGTVLEGQKKYQILYDRNLIRLSDGNERKYRILIGADGINSKVRTYVQRRWNASIFCFENFISNESKENIIKIDFGKVIGGYSWRIPGENRVGIGLGEFYIRGMKRNINKYKNYFESQGVRDFANTKGAFVSCGSYVKRPLKNNVILVGDAAGLVDAMTGEGIYFAMESGKQAALAINDYFSEDKPLTDYTKRLKKIHRKMREQNIYNKFLYVPVLQKMSIQYMKKNPDFVKSVLDNAISSYQTGYTQEVWKSLRKK